MVDVEARALLDAITQAADRLRNMCHRLTFTGDPLACAAGADAADRFVASTGARLLARAEAGDGHARDNLMRAARNVLASVQDTSVADNPPLDVEIPPLPKGAGAIGLVVGGLLAAYLAGKLL